MASSAGLVLATASTPLTGAHRRWHTRGRCSAPTSHTHPRAHVRGEALRVPAVGGNARDPCGLEQHSSVRVLEEHRAPATRCAGTSASGSGSPDHRRRRHSSDAPAGARVATVARAPSTKTSPRRTAFLAAVTEPKPNASAASSSSATGRRRRCRLRTRPRHCRATAAPHRGRPRGSSCGTRALRIASGGAGLPSAPPRPSLAARAGKGGGRGGGGVGTGWPATTGVATSARAIRLDGTPRRRCAAVPRRATLVITHRVYI